MPKISHCITQGVFSHLTCLHHHYHQCGTPIVGGLIIWESGLVIWELKAEIDRIIIIFNNKSYHLIKITIIIIHMGGPGL